MGHFRQIVYIYYRCKFRFISWCPVSQEGICLSFINCSKENTVTIRSVLSCVKINKYQFSVPITWYGLFHLLKIINFHCCLNSQTLPFQTFKWNEIHVAIFRTSPEIRKVCCKLIKSWKKNWIIYTWLLYRPRYLSRHCPLRGTWGRGSIPGHDISKSLKMILAAFRLPLPIYEIVICKPAPLGPGIAGIQWCLNAEFLPHHRLRSPGELRGFDSRY